MEGDSRAGRPRSVSRTRPHLVDREPAAIQVLAELLDVDPDSGRQLSRVHERSPRQGWCPRGRARCPRRWRSYGGQRTADSTAFSPPNEPTSRAFATPPASTPRAGSRGKVDRHGPRTRLRLATWAPRASAARRIPGGCLHARACCLRGGPPDELAHQELNDARTNSRIAGRSHPITRASPKARDPLAEGGRRKPEPAHAPRVRPC